MFQTQSFTTPICRQPAQQRARPEHYAITPVGVGRPCIVNQKNEDTEEEEGFTGVFEILPCSGNTGIWLRMENGKVVAASEETSTRAGCGSSGGS